MNEKQKAEELITHFKMILMNEDTDCGCEILCTLIAKKCALVTVNEFMNNYSQYNGIHDQEYFNNELQYWQQIKKEIENY